MNKSIELNSSDLKWVINETKYALHQIISSTNEGLSMKYRRCKLCAEEIERTKEDIENAMFDHLLLKHHLKRKTNKGYRKYFVK